jgi:hypothetical protein
LQPIAFKILEGKIKKCNFINRMAIGILFLFIFTVLFSINANGESNITACINLLLLNSNESPKSSYELQKTDLYIDRYGIRQDFPGTFVHAIAYADFDNDGDEDVFMAGGDGSPNPTDVEMYLNDGSGNFTYDLTIFSGEIPEAIHPRKALVGDYNNDNRPDIFIADHGWDNWPSPGAFPVLLLSSPNGLQSSGDFSSIVGFHHGAASADIDSDGDLDIFVVDGIQPFFLKNDGKGNFTYVTNIVPDELQSKGIYTTELIDIDLDGYYDLLVAGHEFEGMDTFIYWGNFQGIFSAENKTPLPSVDGQGVIVDIDAEDIDNDGDKDIVLTRTGSDGDDFYIGYYIQIIVNNNAKQFIDDTLNRITNNGTGSNWIDWIRLQDKNGDQFVDIIVDDASRNLIWWNDGTGKFIPN